MHPKASVWRRSHKSRDPLDRVLGYLDFCKGLLQGEVAESSCLAGTSGRVAPLEADIAEAMKLYGVRAKWSAQSLALYTQAAVQGSFILAKAKGGPEVAATSIDHLRRYIELLFKPAEH